MSSTPAMKPRPRTSPTPSSSSSVRRPSCRRSPSDGGVLDQVLVLEDLEVAQGDGAGGRVGGVGEAVHEAVGFGLRGCAWWISLRDDGAGQRDVGAGHRLGEGHDVRLDVPVAQGEPAAGASEAGDHLVGDEQHVVAVADLAQLGEVVRRRAGSRRRRPAPARR